MSDETPIIISGKGVKITIADGYGDGVARVTTWVPAGVDSTLSIDKGGFEEVSYRGGAGIGEGRSSSSVPASGILNTSEILPKSGGYITFYFSNGTYTPGVTGSISITELEHNDISTISGLSDTLSYIDTTLLPFSKWVSFMGPDYWTPGYNTGSYGMTVYKESPPSYFIEDPENGQPTALELFRDFNASFYSYELEEYPSFLRITSTYPDLYIDSHIILSGYSYLFPVAHSSLSGGYTVDFSLTYNAPSIHTIWASCEVEHTISNIEMYYPSLVGDDEEVTTLNLCDEYGNVVNTIELSSSNAEVLGESKNGGEHLVYIGIDGKLEVYNVDTGELVSSEEYDGLIFGYSGGVAGIGVIDYKSENITLSGTSSEIAHIDVDGNIVFKQGSISLEADQTIVVCEAGGIAINSALFGSTAVDVSSGKGAVDVSGSTGIQALSLLDIAEASASMSFTGSIGTDDILFNGVIIAPNANMSFISNYVWLYVASVPKTGYAVFQDPNLLKFSSDDITINQETVHVTLGFIGFTAHPRVIPTIDSVGDVLTTLPSLTINLYGGGHIDCEVPPLSMDCVGTFGNTGILSITMPSLSADLQSGGYLNITMPSLSIGMDGIKAEIVQILCELRSLTVNFQAVQKDKEIISVVLPIFEMSCVAEFEALQEIGAEMSGDFQPMSLSGLIQQSGNGLLGVDFPVFTMSCTSNFESLQEIDGIMSGDLPSMEFSADVVQHLTGSIEVDIPALSMVIDTLIGASGEITAALSRFTFRMTATVGFVGVVDISMPLISADLCAEDTTPGTLSGSFPGFAMSCFSGELPTIVIRHRRNTIR